MIFKLYKSNRFYNSSSEKLKEGKATIYVDGKAVAEGIGYGPEETRFTGKIDKVIVAVK